MPAHHDIENLPWPKIAEQYQDRSRPVADIWREWRITTTCLIARMRKMGVPLRPHGGRGCRAFRKGAE